ncbi:MAG TPA: dihydrofolate reductase family protein [Solirubrobacteraceae bacterium]|nr:dihydrofolate reductase family protein [Solirubrobacteraceae bacterium]
MPAMTAALRHPDTDSFLAALDAAGPVVVAVMVSSVDGRATIGGRVGGLTGPADQRVLLGVRERAGAVLVGARTVAVEGYDRLLGDAARARRTAEGLAPEPELVVFSRASPPLPELLGELRARHPDRPVACEGGPTLLGRLVEARLLDQLVLCLSPRIVADETQRRLLNPPRPLGVELELLATAASDSFLFLRYGLR